MAVKVGEKALVMNESQHFLTENETFTSLTFLDSVTLSNPAEGDAMFSSTDGEYFMLSMYLNSEMMSVRIESNVMFGDIYYESTDGLTYNMMNFMLDNFETGESLTGPTIDFGTEMRLESISNTEILKFFPIKEITFDGIYVVKEVDGSNVWANQEIGIKTPAGKIMAGEKVYTDAGVITGTLGVPTTNTEFMDLFNLSDGLTKYQPTGGEGFFSMRDNEYYPTLPVLDTSLFTSFNSMFSNNNNLKKLDISTFKTTNWSTGANAVSLFSMFTACPELEEVIGFDTFLEQTITARPNIQLSLSGVFRGCTKLKNNFTDLGRFSHRFFGLANMWNGCKSAEIDITDWDLNHVTTFESTFSYGPKVIGIETFSSTSASSITYAFKGNEHIVNFELHNSFPAVMHANYFLSECPNLKTINMSNFKMKNTTSSSIYLDGMFCKNPELEEVDISGWGTYRFSFSGLFEGCTKLKTLNMAGIDYYYTGQYSMAIRQLCKNCLSLEKADFRDLNFTIMTSASNSTDAFTGVPAECLIIVKDQSCKDWFATYWPHLTNVKTVAEYEAA